MKGVKRMEIKALGGCCKKSTANYEAICEAVKELGLDIEVIHVKDMEEIMSLGIMATPGLVVNGKILSAGRALNKKQAKALIEKAISSNCNCGCC